MGTYSSVQMGKKDKLRTQRTKFEELGWKFGSGGGGKARLWARKGTIEIRRCCLNRLIIAVSVAEAGLKVRLVDDVGVPTDIDGVKVPE